MLTNLTIRNRLLILVVVFAAGLIGAVAANRSALTNVAIGGALYSEIIENKDVLADILPPPAYIIDTHAAVLVLASLDPNSAPDGARRVLAFEDITRGKRDFEARMSHWKANTSDRTMLDALAKAAEKGSEYFRVAEGEFIPAIRQNDLPRARAVLDSSLTPIFSEHRRAIDRVVGLATETARELEVRSAARVKSATFQSILISSGVLSAVLVAAWLIGRSITVPLNGIVARLRQIGSGAGDLRSRVPGDGSRSELGELARSFNVFTKAVERIVKDIIETCADLRSKTDIIREAASQTASTMTDQNENVNQIASDTQSVAESGNSVANKATAVTQIAMQAGAQAEEGRQVVERTIQGMHEIESAVSAGAESVTALGQRSEQIGRIITVIKDIADQTNLLALNAAIEAARAGTHGRGFAVVADEVRKLAERTTTATGEVTEAIQQIQSDTSTAVRRIGESRNRVNDGVALATRASDTLQSIVASVSQTSSMIQAIAAEAQEQAARSESIRERITTIAHKAVAVMMENKSTKEASEQMTLTAQRLDEAVAKFEIDRRAMAAERVTLHNVDSNLGKVADISSTGAKIDAAPPALHPGDAITFKTNLGGRQIDVRGSVVWKGTKDAPDAAGIRFADREPAIEKFIASKTTTKPAREQPRKAGAHAPAATPK